MVSIKWYLGCLKGYLGGAGGVCSESSGFGYGWRAIRGPVSGP